MGNIEAVLTDSDSSKIRQAEKRLHEIDKARNDLISLITSGSVDEDSLDGEFQKLYEEEQQLRRKIEVIKVQNDKAAKTQEQLKDAEEIVKGLPCRLTEYDEVIVRKLIECVRVMSKTEITVIFKGGYEMTVEVEK